MIDGRSLIDSGQLEMDGQIIISELTECSAIGNSKLTPAFA